MLGLRGKRLLDVYFLDQSRKRYLQKVRGLENKKYEKPYRRMVREDVYRELCEKARFWDLRMERVNGEEE